MKPNIFKIATSEFSQDAFLVWLLGWADRECLTVDADLHACAVNFVRSLLREKADYDIRVVKAGRQWEHIDVWAEINGEYIIVLEDKKGMKEHSNQLERYANIAKKYYENNKIKYSFVYFKMEPQGNYSDVEGAGFRPFTRREMLPILEQYVKDVTKGRKNDILLDYYDDLKRLDDELNSFKMLPLKNWGSGRGSMAWKGFFETIQKEVGGGWNAWDYVSNRAGGFMGFWWNFHEEKYFDNRKFDIYLQLHEGQMVFRLRAYDPEYRVKTRDYYREILFRVAKEHGVEIKRYGRVGKYMGVAELIGDYREVKNGVIDMNATIENLHRMERVLDAVAKEMDRQ